MKKLYWIGLLFSALLFFGQEKNRTIDALTKEFSVAKTNEEKALILMKISDYWSYRDTAMAFSKLKESEIFIGENSFLKGVYRFYKAGIYYDKDIEKSQKLYMEAEYWLKNVKKSEAYVYRAKLWHNFGTLEQLKGDSQKFLTITTEKCIPLAEKSGDNSLLAGYLVDMGMIFQNYGEYEKAENYYQKAIDLLEKNNIKGENSAWAYLNFANLQIYLKNAEKSRKAIEKARESLENLPESQYQVVFLQTEAIYFNATGQTEKALQSIEKGMRIAQEMNLDYDYFTLGYEKFRLFKSQKKYSEAIEALKQAIGNQQFKNNKKNRLTFLKEMVEIQKELGNYKEALDYLEAYKALNDTILEENEKQQILKLESEFKHKEQQKEIAFLENEKKQQNIIFWTSLGLVASVAIFFVYAYYQRKNLNEQKLLFLQQKQKIDLENALIYGENKERERVAKELHDGIAGRITGVKIGLEHLEREKKDEKIKKSVEQLDACIQDLRRTIRNLTPETLHKFGLEAAVKDFCENMQTQNLKIRCYTSDIDLVENEKFRLNIYRIIQEAVTNAVKHSSASEILVQSTYEENLLLIDIEDNGKGFDVETAQRNLGLDNIERRVKALGGVLKIESFLGKGTSISISVNG